MGKFQGYLDNTLTLTTVRKRIKFTESTNTANIIVGNGGEYFTVTQDANYKLSATMAWAIANSSYSASFQILVNGDVAGTNGCSPSATKQLLPIEEKYSFSST